MTIILGIAGSVLATYAGQALGFYHAGEVAGLIGAVIGSVILLIVYGMIKRT
ncbi:MAG TPA: GlsB/YeaQ/YmgE family stress response membrane protein [Burkholderiales bacterium]|nr:GlsB/YeaQ/YmgE family stress response membrane protein [Burkholderiales bacterium]